VSITSDAGSDSDTVATGLDALPPHDAYGHWAELLSACAGEAIPWRDAHRPVRAA